MTTRKLGLFLSAMRPDTQIVWPDGQPFTLADFTLEGTDPDDTRMVMRGTPRPVLEPEVKPLVVEPVETEAT